MNVVSTIEVCPETSDVYSWIGQVLTSFAGAEQVLGSLSLEVGLPVTNGPLSSLVTLRERVRAVESAPFKAFDKSVERWCRTRPFRNLLAHATITVLKDQAGLEVIVTRHLPSDKDDATPDRIWTPEERLTLLREVRAHSASVRDRANAILADSALLKQLRA